MTALDLYCESCLCDIDDATYGRNDGTCDDCQAKTFKCSWCGDRTNADDASDIHPELCRECGEYRDEEEKYAVLEAAYDELTGLVAELYRSEDMDTIRKMISALKALPSGRR